MATARRSADARAARAAEIRAAAVEAVALIRDAVARGERVPFFDFVDGRAVPENRMRKAFAALTGGTWTAAHRKEARAVRG